MKYLEEKPEWLSYESTIGIYREGNRLSLDKTEKKKKSSLARYEGIEKGKHGGNKNENKRFCPR